MIEKNSVTGRMYLDYETFHNVEKNSRLEFSLLDGNNYYRIPDEVHMGRNMEAFIGTHISSETSVRITPVKKESKSIGEDCYQVFKYQNFVRNIMPQNQYEWPIDFIEYELDSEWILAYVFPLKAYPKFIPIKELLYQEKTSKKLDWRNEEIRDVVRNLLAGFDGLQKNGYYYNDFDMHRIFFEPNSKRIFLRHHLNMRAYKSEINESVNINELSIEFLPPYLYGKGEGNYGNCIDNYAICSMIFCLMIGRMPYEGKGLSNYGVIFDPIRGNDELMHQYYFEHYHQYPIFIFDPIDDSNSLGPMSDNDLPRERWNALPEQIREMFQNVLGNVEENRKEKLNLYSPEIWLKELNRWCWK